MKGCFEVGLIFAAAVSVAQSHTSADLANKNSVIAKLERAGVQRTDIRGVFLAVFEKQLFDLKRGVKFSKALVGVQGGVIPAEWRKSLAASSGKSVDLDNPNPKWGTEVSLRVGAATRAADGFFMVEAARMWGPGKAVVEQFKVGKSKGKWIVWRCEEARRF